MFNFLMKDICLLFLLCSLSARANTLDMEPGQCLSRFDFDYKVLQKLLELESNIKELKEKKSLPEEKTRSAFMATLTAHITNPEVGSTVVFDSAITNEGNAYSPATGVFEADVGGIYNFQLTASSPVKELSSWIHLYLMKNSEKIGYLFLDDNNDRWLQRHIAVVVHLGHGDQVFVKIGKTLGSGTLGGCCLHTHFSGFLIHKD